MNPMQAPNTGVGKKLYKAGQDSNQVDVFVIPPLDDIAAVLEHLRPANFPRKYRKYSMTDEQCKYLAEMSDHNYRMIRDYFHKAV